MKDGQAGSETHQQEHRFEFPRAARQKGPRRTGARRQGFASPRHARPCPLRAVLHPSKIATGGSGGNSNHSRYGTIPRGAGFQPALVFNVVLDIRSLLMEAPVQKESPIVPSKSPTPWTEFERGRTLEERRFPDLLRGKGRERDNRAEAARIASKRSAGDDGI